MLPLFPKFKNRPIQGPIRHSGQKIPLGVFHLRTVNILVAAIHHDAVIINLAGIHRRFQFFYILFRRFSLVFFVCFPYPFKITLPKRLAAADNKCPILTDYMRHKNGILFVQRQGLFHGVHCHPDHQGIAHAISFHRIFHAYHQQKQFFPIFAVCAADPDV